MGLKRDEWLSMVGREHELAIQRTERQKNHHNTDKNVQRCKKKHKNVK